MRNCYQCHGSSSVLILAGVLGGTRGPGHVVYVGLCCVAGEFERHITHCRWCTDGELCDVAHGLRVALTAKAKLMQDPPDDQR